jgi:Tfp pilus assembly protein PilP
LSKHLYLAALASLLLAVAPSVAQAPAGAASPAPAPAASPAPAGGEAKAGDEQTIDEILAGEEEVMSGEGYSYDPAGRRDPFVSLLQRNVAKELQQPRPEGIPGLLIDEVEVKGIYTVSGRTFAQVQTSNKGKNYTIQEGDQLYDGEVVSITAGTVTFKQVVNDPSVIKPFREVVKKLNPEP